MDPLDLLPPDGLLCSCQSQNYLRQQLTNTTRKATCEFMGLSSVSCFLAEKGGLSWIWVTLPSQHFGGHVLWSECVQKNDCFHNMFAMFVWHETGYASKTTGQTHLRQWLRFCQTLLCLPYPSMYIYVRRFACPMLVFADIQVRCFCRESSW